MGQHIPAVKPRLHLEVTGAAVAKMNKVRVQARQTRRKWTKRKLAIVYDEVGEPVTGHGVVAVEETSVCLSEGNGADGDLLRSCLGVVGGDRNLSRALWQCWPDHLVQHTTKMGAPAEIRPAGVCT